MKFAKTRYPRLANWSLAFMNTPLHRKQIFILALAATLALASYWIPLPPHQNDAQRGFSRGSDEQIALVETVDYLRQPAAVWRFPVTVQAPQTPIGTAHQPAKLADVPATLPENHLINQKDFVDDAHSPAFDSLMAPVKSPDLSRR